ncbi:MAG TPA: GNAT family N-acetyltransferase [Gemmatimonadales bacterium]|nr:GNAT family N-acetyltransferase [Gemmatimonadales bacterium]
MNLRPATDDDCLYFFQLRCEPVASAMSRRRAPTWEEHVRWWEQTTDLRFVAQETLVRVGTLRLSQDGIVSIIVDRNERGRGFGPAMLKALEPYAQAAGITTMLAEIAYENERSQKAFTNAGWRPVLMEKHV